MSPVKVALEIHFGPIIPPFSVIDCVQNDLALFIKKPNEYFHVYFFFHSNIFQGEYNDSVHNVHQIYRRQSSNCMNYNVCLEKGSDQLIVYRLIDRYIVYIVSQPADLNPFRKPSAQNLIQESVLKLGKTAVICDAAERSNVSVHFPK